MIKFFKILYSKLNSNPKKIKHYLLCYLKSERTFSLDLFYLLKKGSFFSSHKQQILYSQFFCKSEYYVIVLTNLNTGSDKRNHIFDKILKKKIRIHSNHFSNNIFLDCLWHFLKSQIDPIKTSNQFLTEDNRISGFFLITQFLSLKGLKLPTNIIDSGTQLSGIIKAIDIEKASETYLIKPSLKFNFKDPLCFEDVAPQQHTIDLPAIGYHIADDVCVYQGSQIIKHNNLIVYEPSADPRTRHFIAGLHGKIQGLGDQINSVINLPYDGEKEFEKAAIISTRCPTNYFHWMIEYLPKIKIILDSKMNDYPILVEENLPRQHTEAIGILANKFDLKVIFYNPQQRLLIKKLLIPSPVTYHPDDPDVPYWQGAGLIKDLVIFLKQNLTASISPPLEKKRNIFLTRPSHSRGIVNIKDLYKIASNYGFEIITPEKMSLKEQIMLFKNVNVLITPCGSALVNTLFMPENSKVLSLIGEHNKTYSVYSNLCSILNLNYIHLTGQTIQNRSHFSTDLEYVHAPFEINADKFSRLLEETMR